MVLRYYYENLNHLIEFYKRTYFILRLNDEIQQLHYMKKKIESSFQQLIISMSKANSRLREDVAKLYGAQQKSKFYCENKFNQVNLVPIHNMYVNKFKLVELE